MGSCCITQGAQPSALRQPKGVGWGGGRGGREGVQEEEDICTLVADPCCGMAEANRIL